MASMKIRVFKNNNKVPDNTITIPLGIVRIADKIIPMKVKEAMEEKGVDISAIAEAAKSDDILGIIAEIEDHRKNEKTVISIE